MTASRRGTTVKLQSEVEKKNFSSKTMALVHMYVRSYKRQSAGGVLDGA